MEVAELFPQTYPPSTEAVLYDPSPWTPPGLSPFNNLVLRERLWELLINATAVVVGTSSSFSWMLEEAELKKESSQDNFETRIKKSTIKNEYDGTMGRLIIMCTVTNKF